MFKSCSPRSLKGISSVGSGVSDHWLLVCEALLVFVDCKNRTKTLLVSSAIVGVRASAYDRLPKVCNRQSPVQRKELHKAVRCCNSWWLGITQIRCVVRRKAATCWNMHEMRHGLHAIYSSFQHFLCPSMVQNDRITGIYFRSAPSRASMILRLCYASLLGNATSTPHALNIAS